MFLTEVVKNFQNAIDETPKRDRTAGKSLVKEFKKEAVFNVRGVSKVYQMGEVEVHALRSVDLDLYDGELAVLLGEQAVLTLLAIPLGYFFGFIICLLANNFVDAEIMRLPIVFTQRTFLVTFIITVAAAVISGLIVVWRLRNLDLIEVLKTRE